MMKEAAKCRQFEEACTPKEDQKIVGKVYQAFADTLKQGAE